MVAFNDPTVLSSILGFLLGTILAILAVQSEIGKIIAIMGTIVGAVLNNQILGNETTLLFFLFLCVGFIAIYLYKNREKPETPSQEEKTPQEEEKILKIEVRPEWRNYQLQTNEGLQPPIIIKLAIFFRFHNHLGKATTINEVIITRENKKSLRLPQGTSIPKDESYPLTMHIFELGEDTAIKGKFIVKHTHGCASEPFDTEIPVPIDELPRFGMQIFSAPEGRRSRVL